MDLSGMGNSREGAVDEIPVLLEEIWPGSTQHATLGESLAAVLAADLPELDVPALAASLERHSNTARTALAEARSASADVLWGALCTAMFVHRPESMASLPAAVAQRKHKLMRLCAEEVARWCGEGGLQAPWRSPLTTERRKSIIFCAGATCVPSSDCSTTTSRVNMGDLDHLLKENIEQFGRIREMEDALRTAREREQALRAENEETQNQLELRLAQALSEIRTMEDVAQRLREALSRGSGPEPVPHEAHECTCSLAELAVLKDRAFKQKACLDTAEENYRSALQAQTLLEKQVRSAQKQLDIVTSENADLRSKLSSAAAAEAETLRLRAENAGLQARLRVLKEYSNKRSTAEIQLEETAAAAAGDPGDGQSPLREAPDPEKILLQREVDALRAEKFALEKKLEAVETAAEKRGSETSQAAVQQVVRSLEEDHAKTVEAVRQEASEARHELLLEREKRQADQVALESLRTEAAHQARRLMEVSREKDTLNFEAALARERTASARERAEAAALAAERLQEELAALRREAEETRCAHESLERAHAKVQAEALEQERRAHEWHERAKKLTAFTQRAVNELQNKTAEVAALAQSLDTLKAQRVADSEALRKARAEAAHLQEERACLLPAVNPASDRASLESMLSLLRDQVRQVCEELPLLQGDYTAALEGWLAKAEAALSGGEGLPREAAAAGALGAVYYFKKLSLRLESERQAWITAMKRRETTLADLMQKHAFLQTKYKRLLAQKGAASGDSGGDRHKLASATTSPTQSDEDPRSDAAGGVPRTPRNIFAVATEPISSEHRLDNNCRSVDRPGGDIGIEPAATSGSPPLSATSRASSDGVPSGEPGPKSAARGQLATGGATSDSESSERAPKSAARLLSSTSRATIYRSPVSSRIRIIQARS